MPKNDYAKRLQLRKQLQTEIVQRWTAQLCLDVMTLVLNDPEVMGKGVLGKGRLQKVGEAFNKYYDECVVGLSSDVEASYIYGVNPSERRGSCNYSGITGRCKIAVRPDGSRTVAPVENCPYFHPKVHKR